MQTLLGHLPQCFNSPGPSITFETDKTCGGVRVGCPPILADLVGRSGLVSPVADVPVRRAGGRLGLVAVRGALPHPAAPIHPRLLWPLLRIGRD